MQSAHSVKASGAKKQKKAGAARVGEKKNNPASFDQDQAGWHPKDIIMIFILYTYIYIYLIMTFFLDTEDNLLLHIIDLERIV